MRLEKWYGDVVIDGRATVFYRANLQLGPLTVGYSGRLGQGRMASTRVGTCRLPLPAVVEGDLRWPGTIDLADLRWQDAAHRPQCLWQQGEQGITWDPVVLNGEFTGDGHGRGYAERLVLDVAPWRLGLKILKWGRFCGRRHSFVWIEWVGDEPLRLALLDGQAVALGTAGRREVVSPAARLTLAAPTVIVSDALGAGALQALGWLRLFAAQRFLAGIETKWVAEAVLEPASGGIDQGFVIYEEVVWD